MSLVGQPAPTFENLPSTRNPLTLDEPVSLSDYAGRWLVLLFYSADFSFVCPSEVLAFSHAALELAELGADVLAISTDSVHCHQAWIEFALGKLTFPLASDRTMDVSRDYGVLNEATGTAEHALLLIDPQATVRYQVVHDPGTGRSVDEVSRLLHALTGEAGCPADWRPGAPRLLASH